MKTINEQEASSRVAKVPEVTIVFWIIKILCTTIGETGGDAFSTGTDFVTFDPYFKEFNELLGRQWLITYRSANTGSGFRRIEVTTDVDVPLLYPAGYRSR